jgi:hypothetical protein
MAIKSRWINSPEQRYFWGLRLWQIRIRREMYHCAHCNSSIRECVAHYIDDEGNLWSVPVKICTNVECLAKQGATITVNARKEYKGGEYPRKYTPSPFYSI